MQADPTLEETLEFLRGIEMRHDEVLDQLEHLNTRIEQVLSDCNRDRQHPVMDAGAS